MLMNKKKKREKNIKSMTVKKEDKKTKTQHARQKNVKIKNSWSRQVFLGKKLAIFM